MKSRTHNGFYMIYAVLFVVSVGIACAFYLHSSYSHTQIDAYTHAKITLNLYARSFKSMVLLCLKQKDIATCQHQSLNFPPNYRFRANLSEIDSGVLLLDIHGFVFHPASRNIMRVNKRYVLFTDSTQNRDKNP